MKANGRSTPVVAHWDEGAERSVLGAVLLRNEALPRVSLAPDDFHDPRNRLLWGAMQGLARQGKPIDTLMLEAELGDRMAAVGLAHLSDCVGVVPTADNIEHYAAIVAEASLTRRVRVACSEILGSRAEGEDLLRHAERALGGLLRQRAVTTNERPLTTDVRAFVGDDEPEDDDTFSSQDWVVPQFIPRAGLTIIGGPPKIGKTWVLLELAISVASGLPFCGHWPVSAGRVLALLEEDTKRRIQRRLWRLARGRGLDPRDLGGQLRLAAMAGFRLDREDMLAALDRELAEHKPDLVLIDALARVHGADENDRTGMRAVTVPLQDLCARHGVAIGLIHHFRKLGQGDEKKRAGELLRGTSDLWALARSVIGVTRRADVPGLVIEALGNDGEVPFSSIAITSGTNTRGKPTVAIEYRGLTEDAHVTEDAARVLTVIRAAMPDGLGVRELRAAVRQNGPMASERMDAAVAHLQTTGVIYRSSLRGLWRSQEGA